ncbi:MAG: dynamin family protein [Betaproteobacteria bacterium]|nr:dynamin family protein [Betaproteobacteria bacterium]
MDFNANIDNRFETEIARYNQWREELTRAVHDYHDWLERTNQLDVQQSIRFYDLLETLNRGRLTLAFLAEFSRGKSELINALFFSSFKERLLPSDVGRTTMCPTELFHDPNEEPYLKLLSVETRYRDESISQLKNMPVEWSKIRLNVNDPKEMKQALSALADTKRVYALDARMMGLIPMFDESGQGPNEDDIVEVPAWRYAVINYPHPLLTNGLSILDTPGLNALGLEPELTLSTVPNAHAVLFLLAIDTGVTKSDLEIWERYVKAGLPAKIAVLNKIDVMWDELKTAPEIEAGMKRMIDTTCTQLGLPPEKVFALSAQKALLGRIKGDPQMVQRSGIEKLEAYLANEIIPIKRQLLAKAVTSEIGAMMVASHRSCTQKLEANQAQLNELGQLAGKSRELTQKLWQKVSEEKEAYNNALSEYKVQRTTFNQKRNALLDVFNPTKLDIVCSRSLQAINDSWTTPGLTRGMRQLITLVGDEFKAVSVAGEDILHLMEGVYNTFHQRFNFDKMDFPPLDFEGPRNKLQILIYETEQFCKDPVNIVMTEKRFMVRRFWRMLIDQARKIFNEARADTERWLAAVPLPLETQIKDHKAQLQARLDALAKVNERGGAITEEVNKLQAQRKDIQNQIAMITSLIMKVRDVGPNKTAASATAPAAAAATASAISRPVAAAAPAAAASAETNPEFLKTVKMVVPKDQPAEFATTQKLDLSKLS